MNCTYYSFILEGCDPDEALQLAMEHFSMILQCSPHVSVVYWNCEQKVKSWASVFTLKAVGHPVTYSINGKTKIPIGVRTFCIQWNTGTVSLSVPKSIKTMSPHTKLHSTTKFTLKSSTRTPQTPEPGSPPSINTKSQHLRTKSQTSSPQTNAKYLVPLSFKN